MYTYIHRRPSSSGAAGASAAAPARRISCPKPNSAGVPFWVI